MLNYIVVCFKKYMKIQKSKKTLKSGADNESSAGPFIDDLPFTGCSPSFFPSICPPLASLDFLMM